MFSSIKRKALIILISIIAFGSQFACRFVVPDEREQQAMLSKGMFPRGAPAWFGGILVKQRQRKMQSPLKASGLIADSFSLDDVGDPGGANFIREQRETLASASPKEELNDSGEKKDSPLNRIAAVCPGLEKNAGDAMITLDREERLSKYKMLTVRCPDSYDLWIWLAKDYFELGFYDKSSMALSRVLAINPGNSDAMGLRSLLRKRQLGTEDF